MRNPERELWASVLHLAIEEAGGRIRETVSKARRAQIQRQARIWLTRPNTDFNDVCHLAGVDPEAVRDRALVMFGECEGAGVVKNFEHLEGTGGGTLAQHSPQMEFFN